MPTVRRLMQQTNPVSNDATQDLLRVEEKLVDVLNPSVQKKPVPARSSRRRLILAGVGAAVIAGAGVAGFVQMRASTPPPTADEPFFATSEQLEGRADLIVRGVIKSARAVTGENGTETAATVEVEKVAKGDVRTGTSIQVLYTPVGSGPETPEGLRRGGEYVFLLEPRDATGWNLISSTQGYYTVSSNSATPATDNPVILSPETRRALGLS
jgi:hypothetical protein